MSAAGDVRDDGQGGETNDVSNVKPNDAIRDPWYALAGLTPARVALGRAGSGLPTARHLELQLAHARSRDAVARTLDAAGVADAFRRDGVEVVRVRSAAHDRREFLTRPDHGRRLADGEPVRLAAHAAAWDLAFVVGDGLAALAAERHAPALVRLVRARLTADANPWRIAPVVVAERARVALGDEVGAALGARFVVVLLGERPGMSAPDSLGVYLTWAPRPGRTDAERNCVSNVRPDGLPIARAADTVAWLARAARQRQRTGVGLRADGLAQLAGATNDGSMPR